MNLGHVIKLSVVFDSSFTRLEVPWLLCRGNHAPSCRQLLKAGDVFHDIQITLRLEGIVGREPGYVSLLW